MPTLNLLGGPSSLQVLSQLGRIQPGIPDLDVLLQVRFADEQQPWFCHPSPPPAYLPGSVELEVELPPEGPRANTPRSGAALSWWDRHTEEIPFLSEQRTNWVKNSDQRDPFPLGGARGFLQDQFGLIARRRQSTDLAQELPPLQIQTPENSPSPPPYLWFATAESDIDQEIQSTPVANPQLVSCPLISSGAQGVITVSDSDSRTSTPRGADSPDYSPPEVQSTPTLQVSGLGNITS